MKSKIIATVAIAAVVFMVFSVAGSATYSWFYDSEDVDIEFNIAVVDISTGWGVETAGSGDEVVTADSIANMYPGYSEDRTYTIDNDSNVPIHVKTYAKIEADVDSDVDPIYVVYDGSKTGLELGADYVPISGWTAMTVGCDPVKSEVTIGMELGAGNAWSGKEVEIIFKTVAYQYGEDIELDEIDGAYIIRTVSDMQLFSSSVNGGNSYSGKTVRLGNDIDLKGVEWVPIGTVSNPFSGTFDGDGKIISNLKISSGISYAGLFGCTEGATIRNLSIVDVDIVGKECVGALVGNGGGVIDNIKVSGTIKIDGNKMVGGVIGAGYCNVTNSSIIGDQYSYVRGTYLNDDLEGSHIGGFYGYASEGNYDRYGLTVSNLAIDGSKRVGGVFGTLQYSNDSGNHVNNIRITDCAISIDGDVPEGYYVENDIYIGGVAGLCSYSGIFDGSVIERTTVVGKFKMYTGPVCGLGHNHGIYNTPAEDFSSVPKKAKIGNVEYATIGEAIGVANGIVSSEPIEVVILDDEVLSSSTLSIEKDMILDGNGKTLKILNNSKQSVAIDVVGGVEEFTMKDFTINIHYSAHNWKNNVIDINNPSSDGTITIDSCTIIGDDVGVGLFINGAYTLVCTDTDFIADSTNNDKKGMYMRGKGSNYTISGCDFTGWGTAIAMEPYSVNADPTFYKYGDVRISGCYFNLKNSSGPGSVADHNGKSVGLALYVQDGCLPYNSLSITGNTFEKEGEATVFSMSYYRGISTAIDVDSHGDVVQSVYDIVYGSSSSNEVNGIGYGYRTSAIIDEVYREYWQFNSSEEKVKE